MLVSAEGIQQGDPLGPWLFSLATLPILFTVDAQLKFAYLDELTLGGDFQSLVGTVDHIRQEAAAAGLVMTDGKSEVICDPTTPIPPDLSNFSHTCLEDANLLGVPLYSDSALSHTLDQRVTWLSQMSIRLNMLQSQDALLLLRHSFSSFSI